jgi:pectate lyase
MELAYGSEEAPLLFVGRRDITDWNRTSWKDAVENNLADRPGQKVWEHWSYLADYYVVPAARPLIRLHLGRPPLGWVTRMKLLYPALPQSAREEIPARIARIVEALGPYGAKKLPVENPMLRRYILPGGTLLTFSDYTNKYSQEVRLTIDLEPVEPAAGREGLPLMMPWRRDDRLPAGRGMPAGVMEYLQRPQAGRAAEPGPARTPPRGEWSAVADGFASVNAMDQNGTTGGAGGRTVTVTNQVELERYAAAEEPCVIRIEGAITITPKGHRKNSREVFVASDKTIVGVGTTGEIVGGGFFAGANAHNIIIRNLTIRDTYVKGDWWGKSQDFDGLQLDAAHHVWVDHCHFQRHGDGCIDSRKGTTYLTISWCVFSDHNKTLAIGWDEDLSNQVTLHHNWFRNVNCRNPRVGGALRVHLYNNYVQNVGWFAHESEGSNMIVQNSLFDNVSDPLRCRERSTLAATGNIFRNVRGGRETRGRAFFDPARFYPYTLDKAEDLPGILAEYAGPQANIGHATEGSK